MNRPSNFTSHAALSYDLFLTAAIDGCVKLWDLRICKPVSRYAAHANRTLPLIKTSFSPCMRFIACGGEDKNVTLCAAAAACANVGPTNVLWCSGGSLSLGSLVGFVTVLGIAARNGIPVSTTNCIVGATMGVGLMNGNWR